MPAIKFYKIASTGECFETKSALVDAQPRVDEVLRWEHCPGAGWGWAPLRPYSDDSLFCEA